MIYKFMAKRQKDPRERFSYLRELVTEFQDSSFVGNNTFLLVL